MIEIPAVTRLEIIDHTTCQTCKGKMYIRIEGEDKLHECPECHATGSPGRAVVFWDPKKKIELSLQDDERTLKIFISERG